MCLVVTVWALIQYVNYGIDYGNAMTDSWSPTLKYFDENRDAKPFVDLYWKVGACDPTYNTETLYSWPGTVEGCAIGNTATVGKCTTGAAGTLVSA